MNSSLRALLICLCVLPTVLCAHPVPSSIAPRPEAINRKMAEAPLLFTENKGQVADAAGNLRPDILFTAHSNGAKVFLTAMGIHYQFTRMEYPEGYERNERRAKDPELQRKLHSLMKTSTHRFTLSLAGANPHPRIRRDEQQEYTENFYLAHCPDGITGVHTYSRLVYEDVYPGIDWVMYSNKQGLKYDFVVHPGADPARIKLKVNDAESVGVSKDGELVIKTSLGEVREQAPVSYCGAQVVASSFVQVGTNEVGFVVGSWDKSLPLIVDPSVSWATYYGGTGSDYGYFCAGEGTGNIYLAGVTDATAGIASGGSQNTSGGNNDAFLVKFSASGSRLWATYYGGASEDNGFYCAADGIGNVFLAGTTSSTSGIAFGGSQNIFGGGANDAFLVKFSASGSRLWATYYGGTGDDYNLSCAADGSGNIFLAGTTSSISAIASGGSQNTFGGGTYDAFLVKFSASGSRLWATYYGGTGIDVSYSCAADGSGNIYLAGATGSRSGIASGGSQNTFGGSPYDAFLVKFSTSGSRLWATYYGGTGVDFGFSCAADGSGNIYLAGSTSSTSGIASGGFQSTFGGSPYDAFLVKFSASGSRQWATYFGETGDDGASSCAADGSGNIYLAGSTSSTSGISSGGLQNTFGGGANDAFLAKLSASGSLLWATYYGGSKNEAGYSCAADGNGNIFLAGYTVSTSGIAFGGLHNSFGGGANDAFLVKIQNCADNSVTQKNDTLTANATNATYQWVDCNNKNAVISGAINQTFIAGKVGRYAVQITQNSCTVTSDCFCTNPVPIDHSDESCNDVDVRIVQDMLAEPKLRTRLDFHEYSDETIICDPTNPGSRGCSIEAVWTLIKSRQDYQVPVYEDFPISTAALPFPVLHCLPDINTPFFVIWNAIGSVSKLATSPLNEPIRSCDKVFLSPTPPRILVGAMFQLADISVLNSPTFFEFLKLPCDINIFTEPVKLVVDEPNHCITNYTLNGHFFYPGKVERIVISDCDGNIKVITHGIGFNSCGDTWAGSMISKVNKCTLKPTFDNVNARLKKDFNQ